jgi:transcription antitermination protein NusB
MANRHLSRSVALQTLFEWDFRGCHDKGIKDAISRIASEFAPGMDDTKFINDLVQNILSKKEDIDKIIEKAAPDWPLDKISVIDRNVLRIGLYELLFADRTEVPAKVAINEAIEIAKSFGGENSGKFINGVLGSVYKELGEPGKDSSPKKKKRIEDIPYEEMPIQNLGGAVVYAKDGDDIYMAFVHDIFGHWTLSKGKIPAGDIKQGTIAKVKEEMGLDVVIKEDLGNNEYIASDPELGKIRKQVHYFLAESKFTDIKLAEKPGLDDAKWFKLADILELNFYNDIVSIVTKGLTILSQTK